MSVEHESHIAHLYFGERSPSSGGAIGDQGDVRTEDDLIECKMTGTYEKYAKSITIKLDVIEKIADEAWSEGKEWALALRIYNPDSRVADKAGYIDIIARPLEDDLLRESLLERAREERLVSSLRLCCAGGACDEHKEDGRPWIPSPEEVEALRAPPSCGGPDG